MSSSSSQSPVKFIGAVEDHWELYSDNSEDYTLGAPIGFGASSIVYSAVYRPKSKPSEEMPCALKVLDLDSLPPRALSLLQRETTLMSLSKHPNVLRVRGSWMDGHKLYIALRLMSKGSAADVMSYGWPGGMEEEVVRCILRQALQGLNYLHINGFIHRDIKAANLLIDDDGTVLLGDLGVAANLTEDTSHHIGTATRPHQISSAAAVKQPGPSFSLYQTNQHARSDSGGSGASKRAIVAPRIVKRNSFVGTPCWMAPELIQGKQYDSSADIWSFGITALELTQGRPPRSRETPQKVLLRTIQEAPPTLDREGGTFKYSRAFQEMVESCLVKDPSKRPTAEQLLATPFFKGAKKKSYLINTILADLPPLAQRQQRRVLAKVQNRNSVDSWDFATTVHSTVPSLHSTIHSHSHFSILACNRSVTEDAAVFEMEECLCEPGAETKCQSCTQKQNETICLGNRGFEVVDDDVSIPTSSPPDSDFPEEGSQNTTACTSPTPSSERGIPIKSPLDPVPSPSSSMATSASVSSKTSSSGLWKKIKSAARRPSGMKK